VTRDRDGAGARSGSPRFWQNLWVRLAVALAFADASIVVLALPQIIDRLHTTVDLSAWVIMAYNLALIVTSVTVVLAASRMPATPVLISGLAVFGLASIGCGVSNSLGMLVALRCVQGVGGALVLSASLPMFAAAARPGDSPLNGWSAAAAIGAAVGPAAGGILTQLFDWRSIFLAQAPFAAFAAIAVLLVRHGATSEASAEADRPASALDPFTANGALLLLSAGIIGALFLVVIELINGWLLSPIAAAAIVTTIPVATALGERLVRGRSAALLGAAGAIMLVVGLLILGQLPHRELGWVVLALLLCGGGIGLAFPGLTAVALETGGTTAARAAKTVAARDAGLVVGLLILVPIFSNQITAVNKLTDNLSSGPAHQAIAAIGTAPLPTATKTLLFVDLLNAVKHSGTADVPRVDPIFARISATAAPADRATLASLRTRVDAIIQDAVTPAFHRPYRYAALLAVLVLPLLGLRLVLARRTGPGSPAEQRSPV
jgi:predicted MFS family arabinose efflux permease